MASSQVATSDNLEPDFSIRIVLDGLKLWNSPPSVVASDSGRVQTANPEPELNDSLPSSGSSEGGGHPLTISSAHNLVFEFVTTPLNTIILISNGSRLWLVAERTGDDGLLLGGKGLNCEIECQVLALPVLDNNGVLTRSRVLQLN